MSSEHSLKIEDDRLHTLQFDNSSSTPPNHFRKSSLFLSGIWREVGNWLIMHSGARTAMIGSIVQASQARMKASVVWRMVVVIGVDISFLVPDRWGWLGRLQVGRLL